MKRAIGFIALLFLLSYSSQSSGVPSMPQDLTDNRETEFFRAVKRGDIEQVTNLLAHGIDIHTRSTERFYQGYTALHYAAQGGQDAIMQLLLSRGANLSIAANRNDTPLYVASLSNQPAAVELLLKNGADPNEFIERDGPFDVAITAGNSDIVEIFLKAGSNPNFRHPDGATPLFNFSRIGTFHPVHITILETLIRHGANVNARRNDGDTPLGAIRSMVAGPAVAILIQHGAHLSKDDPIEILSKAALTGSAEALAYLENQGFVLKMINANGQTLLHLAARSEEPAALEFLISKGLEPNVPDKRGVTPLYVATAECRVKAVNSLLAKGAKANYQSPQGLTALHAAFPTPDLFNSSWPNCKIVFKMLVASGANVQIRNENGQTLLYRVGYVPELVELLLKNGVDPSAADNEGQTILHLLLDEPTTAETLLKAGANPKDQNKKGRTPLHMFAEWGMNKKKLATARVLVRFGASLDIRDNEGYTPLELFLGSPWGQHPERCCEVPAFVKLLKRES
jgi:ankyrin repeat protein